MTRQSVRTPILNPLPCTTTQVKSFGVGAHVKLPGPSQAEPNVYQFGTPWHMRDRGR